MEKNENKIPESIVDLIKDEWEAIQGYNKVIAELQGKVEPSVISVLEDIRDEENVHVGQLQEVLKVFDPSAEEIVKGTQEGDEQLSGSKEEFEPEDEVEKELYESLKDDSAIEGIAFGNHKNSYPTKEVTQKYNETPAFRAKFLNNGDYSKYKTLEALVKDLRKATGKLINIFDVAKALNLTVAEIRDYFRRNYSGEYLFVELPTKTGNIKFK